MKTPHGLDGLLRGNPSCRREYHFSTAVLPLSPPHVYNTRNGNAEVMLDNLLERLQSENPEHHTNLVKKGAASRSYCQTFTPRLSSAKPTHHQQPKQPPCQKQIHTDTSLPLHSFWSYELCKRAFAPSSPTSPSTSSIEESPSTVLLCGGIAGVVTWASIFPLGKLDDPVSEKESLCMLMKCLIDAYVQTSSKPACKRNRHSTAPLALSRPRSRALPRPQRPPIPLPPPPADPPNTRASCTPPPPLHRPLPLQLQPPRPRPRPTNRSAPGPSPRRRTQTRARPCFSAASACAACARSSSTPCSGPFTSGSCACLCLGGRRGEGEMALVTWGGGEFVCGR